MSKHFVINFNKTGTENNRKDSFFSRKIQKINLKFFLFHKIGYSVAFPFDLLKGIIIFQQ